MKLVFATFLALLMILGLNCKKEEDFHVNPIDLEILTPLPSDYLCTATKVVPGLGSVNWTANAYASMKDEKISIAFITFQDTLNKELREVFRLNNVEISNNKKIRVYEDEYYQKNNNAAFGTYSRRLDDGDVADGFWTVDNSKCNYVKFTKIDLGNRILEGEFDVHFKMKTQSTNGTLYSERINFKNGKFSAEIAM